MENSEFGVVRAPTLQEIQLMVRGAREYRGWKQTFLAAKAGITERTLARVEQGVRVSEDTYRRLALAFGIAEDGFYAERYMPTVEEFVENQAEAERVMNETCDRVTVAPLNDPRAVMSLFGCHGQIVLNGLVHAVDLAGATLVMDAIQDYSDVADVMTSSQRLEGANQVLEFIQEFEARGYHVCYALRPFQFDDGTPWCAGVIAFLRKKEDVPVPTEVWLDKDACKLSNWLPA